jgi:adenosine deaminase
MTTKSTREKEAPLRKIIRKIPKNDLHVHLDGSIRPETIIEISRKEKLDLPSYTLEGLNELVFKDRYANLDEYLTTFAYSGAVLQKPEYLERVAYELALDNQAEGVRYMEVRFAPQLHINESMDMEAVLMAVDKGIKRAQDQFNGREAVRNNSEPPFHYGIIVCAMRNLGPWSKYYRELISSFTYSSMGDVCRLAALELAKGAVKIRDKTGLPVVGFDLAGAEAGHPASRFWEAFQYVHEAFLPKTVHAGEAYGPESIFQALTELHADRIGHGYFLFDEGRIRSRRIKDKKAYITNLAQYIADRRITIEICLTSNLQTNPALKNMTEHNFGTMLQHKLSTTFCTDNRTVSKTSVTREIIQALQNFPLSQKTLRNCIIQGFKRSFFPGDYLSKRKYVRQCIDYYEKVTAGAQDFTFQSK